MFPYLKCRDPVETFSKLNEEEAKAYSLMIVSSTLEHKASDLYLGA